MAASPVGPAESVGDVCEGLDDERDEQALDLVAGQWDQPVWAGLRACSSARTTARKAWASIARVTQRVQEG